MKQIQKIRIRHISSVFAIFAFAFGLLNTPLSGLAKDPSFTDVLPGSKYYDAVEYLKGRGVIGGYDDGTFRPNGTINRAEAMKIVVLGHSQWMNEDFVDPTLTEETQSTEAAVTDGTTPDAAAPAAPPQVFSDVSDEWFAKYVLSGHESGFVNGYEDNTFKPADNINKAESLKIILLAFTDGQEFVDPGKNPFPDVSFSSWFAKYVKFAKDKMVIEPDQFGNFDGNKDITRGEFADIIFRLMYISEHSLNQYDPSLTWQSFDRSTEGYLTKIPEGWEVFEETNEHPAAGSKTRTIFWQKDELNKQRTYMRQYPNSASAEVFVLDGSFDKNTFFAEIRNAFGSDALIIETQTSGMPTLMVESENGTENILDSYIIMPDGRLTEILGTYGNGPLSYKNSFYLRKLRENFVSVNRGKIDDVNIEAVMTAARQNIQVDGKGRATLDTFDDLEIISTDTIGVGTGPVDYYYSAKANITLKYERSFDVILDIVDGQTSGF